MILLTKGLREKKIVPGCESQRNEIKKITETITHEISFVNQRWRVGRECRKGELISD